MHAFQSVRPEVLKAWLAGNATFEQKARHLMSLHRNCSQSHGALSGLDRYLACFPEDVDKCVH